MADALRPRFVKPEADDAAVLAGAKEAMRIASIGDPRDQIRGLERQVTKLNRTLTQRWAPEQMLTFWLPLLRERGRRDLADDAITDADRVLDDDAAAPAAKARALAVRGMALRDEEKYADAKADLEQAKKDLPVADGEWLLETEMALTEASDPSAYFASRAEAFRQEGRRRAGVRPAEPGAGNGGAGVADAGCWWSAGRGGWTTPSPAARAAPRRTTPTWPPPVRTPRTPPRTARRRRFTSAAGSPRNWGSRTRPSTTTARRWAVTATLDADGARYRAALARAAGAAEAGQAGGAAGRGRRQGRQEGRPAVVGRCWRRC